MQARHVALGVAFGFILSRVGATDYDAIFGMFRLTDMHLMGVIGGAVLVNAVGFAWFRKAGTRSFGGEAVTLPQKPLTRQLPFGALLFGMGWALAGTCPGTALAQIGEGRLIGLITFAGILIGSWLAQPRSSTLGYLKAEAAKRDSFQST